MQSARSGKADVYGRASVRTCAGSGTTVRGQLIAGFKMPAMAVAGIVMLVLSCGDGAVEPAPVPPAPVATAVTVNPGSAALSALAETARFTAVAGSEFSWSSSDTLVARVDDSGQVMAGAAVAWASSDASIATVDASVLSWSSGHGGGERECNDHGDGGLGLGERRGDGGAGGG